MVQRKAKHLKALHYGLHFKDLKSHIFKLQKFEGHRLTNERDNSTMRMWQCLLALLLCYIEFKSKGASYMDTVCTKIRQIILSMEKPFCIADLFDVLTEQEIENRDLILQILDELYNEGLIDYRRHDGIVDEPIWAFHIA